MDKLVIQGQSPLQGELEISGAKNAALPILIASLLTEDTLSLTHVPQLQDVNTCSDCGLCINCRDCEQCADE